MNLVKTLTKLQNLWFYLVVDCCFIGKMKLRTGSLSLSRERFPSSSSIKDKNENSIIYEEGKEQQKGESKKPSVRLRSKTTRSDENLRKKSMMNRYSLTLPARNKIDEHGYIDDRIRKISSIENPFTFQEDPILVQQRLQTLGTSDLKVCCILSFLLSFLSLIF